MFKFLFIILVLLFSKYSIALEDSSIESTSTISDEKLLQDNYKEINNLKTNYNSLEVTLDAYDYCSDRNLLYIGKGEPRADSRGCIDVTEGLGSSLTSRKPTFAGFYSQLLYGNLTTSQTGYNPSDTSQNWGRSRADYLCRQQYSNSRAMTMSDYKYVYNSIVPASATSERFLGTTAKKIFVFDFAEGHINDGGGLYLSGQMMTIATGYNGYTCNGYTQGNSVSQTPVFAIKKENGVSKIYVYRTYCNDMSNQGIAIACVYN